MDMTVVVWLHRRWCRGHDVGGVVMTWVMSWVMSWACRGQGVAS